MFGPIARRGPRAARALCCAALLASAGASCSKDKTPAPGSDGAAPPTDGGARDLRWVEASADAARDGTPPPPAGRPNIVFVLADDQRAESIDCMPEAQALIARQGVRFVNTFASTPLCCPSRASILTGKYAHNHHVLQNGDVEEGDTTKTPGAVLFQDHGNEQLVFAKWLKAAGYRTGFFGKYLNGYLPLVNGDRDKDGKPDNYVPPHWDEWRAFPGADYFDYQLIEKPFGAAGRAERVCYLSGPVTDSKDQLKCKEDATRVVKDGKEHYSTDDLREMVLAFIQQAARDDVPFFVYFAPKAPHGPFLSPKRYQPDRTQASFTPEAMARLQGCELFDWKSRPASFLEQDVSDKPEWIVAQAGQLTAADQNKTRKLQLASVLATDDALKAITAALAAANIADETVLIYAGDNGYAWGEHGWGKKNCAYEGCARVPLVAYDPRFPQGGRAIDALTLNVDLTPTFAELAGAPVPAETKVDGESLVAAIQGRSPGPSRDRVLFECWGGDTGPGTHAAVRTTRWKYVVYYDDDARTKVHLRKDGRQELELYDLQRDPHELENLAWLTGAALVAKGYAAGEVEGARATLAAQLAALERE